MQEKVKSWTTEDLNNMETRYRASFINSLGGFKSVVLIGTEDREHQTNLAIFNSLIHLGANPALCAFIIRPDVSRRHTLENIEDTGLFTVNHLNEDIYVKAHQSSARYPKEISEFDATGLNVEYLNGFSAPYVKESIVKFACRFVQKIPIELNGTTLIIGEIVNIHIPEIYVESAGFVDIESAGTITVSGLDSYHKTQKIARLSYAKPDKEPEKI
jgi:flavin reductase (DIM6/NTAB) family NADH-FMN oxidoreductase RutF